jgi:hypothetical protein
MAIDEVSLCESIEPGSASISNSSICTASTVDLTLTGQESSGTIQWQISLDGGSSFSNLSGATPTPYTTRTLNPDSTFYYRAAVTDGYILFRYNVSSSK